MQAIKAPASVPTAVYDVLGVQVRQRLGQLQRHLADDGLQGAGSQDKPSARWMRLGIGSCWLQIRAMPISTRTTMQMVSVHNTPW